MRVQYKLVRHSLSTATAIESLEDRISLEEARGRIREAMDSDPDLARRLREPLRDDEPEVDPVLQAAYGREYSDELFEEQYGKELADQLRTQLGG